MNEIMNSVPGDRQPEKAPGFTILELLISLLLASIVLSAAFGIYITQHNQYLVQEDISEIQGNARAATELLATEIRKTGYLLPLAVTPLVARNTNPDTILIRYATPRITGAELAQDMLDQFSDLICTGNDLQQLVPGDWIYIYDTTATLGEAFTVTNVDYATLAISHSAGPLGRVYLRGSQLYTVTSDKFYVDLADTANPMLMIQRLGQNPEIYAEYIEGLNFTYYMADGSVLDLPTNMDSVRIVGIDVTSKSTRPELNAVNGEYRTRNHFLKVKLRNFGLN